MAQSDLELLLEMGFDRERAELAVKRTGGLQGALTWLEETQDKPLDELKAQSTQTTGVQAGTDEGGPSDAGASAKSLVCNDCGKKFRSQDAASFHASKTDHTDFSESTDEIAPLTEDQKKAKLEELRQKLKEKRATQSIQDKEDAKRNEQIRQKSTKETQDLKEEIARKEQIKEAAKKRQEKLDDAEAKKRIRAKIEADKAERARKAEEAKALREGRATVQAAPAPAPAPAASKPSNHSEAKLRLQTSGGNIVKTYPAETTLFEVAQQLETETGSAVTSFTMTFPRKVFQGDIDMSKTLKEAGLTPSAVLIIK